MIRDSEKEYQTGRANVSDGHLEAAKEDFDRAMGALMEGPVDIGADDKDSDAVQSGQVGLAITNLYTLAPAERQASRRHWLSHLP